MLGRAIYLKQQGGRTAYRVSVGGTCIYVVYAVDLMGVLEKCGVCCRSDGCAGEVWCML